MFHGLIAKMLSQEEQDAISAQYQRLKNDRTVSVRDQTKPLAYAYRLALDRLNNISYPPSKSTFKNEWIAPGVDSNDPELFRWHLIPDNNVATRNNP